MIIVLLSKLIVFNHVIKIKLNVLFIMFKKFLLYLILNWFFLCLLFQYLLYFLLIRIILPYLPPIIRTQSSCTIMIKMSRSQITLIILAHPQTINRQLFTIFISRIHSQFNSLTIFPSCFLELEIFVMYFTHIQTT